MDPFIGEVRLLPFTFAPKGWALCNGQLLPISTNTALFSIIGVQYGGDGKNNFALPNLQGCVVPGSGQGPGLRNWVNGVQVGSDIATIDSQQMPQHTHGMRGLDVNGTQSAPAANTYLARDRRGGQGNVDYLAPGGTALDTSLSPQALSIVGAGQPHENRQPFVSMNFCIALVGVFPQRN